MYVCIYKGMYSQQTTTTLSYFYDKHRKNTIKKHKLELEKMLKENSKMPLNVRGLFIHPNKILQTNIEFLEMALDEIKRGGGKIDKEAYNK